MTAADPSVPDAAADDGQLMPSHLATLFATPPAVVNSPPTWAQPASIVSECGALT
jgi:hypothetical protein